MIERWVGWKWKSRALNHARQYIVSRYYLILLSFSSFSLYKYRVSQIKQYHQITQTILSYKNDFVSFLRCPNNSWIKVNFSFLNGTVRNNKLYLTQKRWTYFSMFPLFHGVATYYLLMATISLSLQKCNGPPLIACSNHSNLEWASTSKV